MDKDIKRGIIYLLLVLLLVISVFLYRKEGESDIYEELELDMEEGELLEEEALADKDIVIHIVGQVKSPGILELKEGSRVIDAIEAAGGQMEDADLDRVNLARKLIDEEKLVIPKIGEVKELVEDSDSTLININQATREELMKLPGVGEKTADFIINYRDKERFNKKEDIMKVSGIGVKTFQGLEDLITTD